jgi:hypothetical protein
MTGFREVGASHLESSSAVTDCIVSPIAANFRLPMKYARNYFLQRRLSLGKRTDFRVFPER